MSFIKRLVKIAPVYYALGNHELEYMQNPKSEDLLDEATSALDVFTERQVLRNIMNMGYARTCIVTTHRPSVLTMCDKVYKIDSGVVCDIDEKEVNMLIRDF